MACRASRSTGRGSACRVRVTLKTSRPLRNPTLGPVATRPDSTWPADNPPAAPSGRASFHRQDSARNARTAHRPHAQIPSSGALRHRLQDRHALEVLRHRDDIGPEPCRKAARQTNRALDGRPAERADRRVDHERRSRVRGSDTRGMTPDHLADVLDLVRVRATLSGAIAVNGRWISRASLCDQLKIIGVLRGHVTIRTNGAPPAALEADDVAVLHARPWLELHGGTGTRPVLEVAAPRGYVRHPEPAGSPSDVVVGGHIDLDDTGRALLTEVLPSLGHLRGSLPQTGSMRPSLRLLFEESAEERSGSSFARRQYGRLLLLEILRTYTSASELPPGWLRAQADNRLRPALAAMHADPSEPMVPARPRRHGTDVTYGLRCAVPRHRRRTAARLSDARQDAHRRGSGALGRGVITCRRIASRLLAPGPGRRGRAGARSCRCAVRGAGPVWPAGRWPRS